MDDVLRRLGLVESAVAELRGDVRHLATKADLKEEVGLLRAEFREQVGLLRENLKEEVGRLATQIASLEGRIIRWLGGTMVASIGAAAAVAKLLI
jgi:hypothetical protein